MIARLVAECTQMVNSFPPKGGISDMIPSHILMTGIQFDCFKCCKLDFGNCCQVYDDTTNDMTPQTAGAICLGQAGNVQGGHVFMSLATGKQMGHPNNQFAKLPATNAVIECAHKLAGNNNTLTVLSQHFEEEDLCNGFAPRSGSESWHCRSE